MFRRTALVVTALSALLVAGLVLPVQAQIPDPDPGDVTAQLDVTKTASSVDGDPITEVGPGDTLVYGIQIACSAISDVGCRGAITTDVIPEPLMVQNVVPSGANDADEPVIDGQNVRVDWIEDLGAGGAIGMLDNTNSQIAITVQVPDNVSFDLDGTMLTNNATAEATNAIDHSASTNVTLNVPLELETTATKAFDPDSALASAGTPITASLTGTNDSNATVDTLVIQDPVDPTAEPNPFTFLGFTGFGTVTPPEGATSTTYEVFVDGEWVEAPGGDLPAGVDPGDVQGTRVTFTGAIPPGATGSVDLELETTDEAAALTEDTTITNDVQSEVTLDGESATGTASADFLIQANTVTVFAAKAFEPDLVVAGQSSTVTLGARNDSPFAIDSMTITEPSSGSFPPEYTFGGFTAGIAYPAGATSGTVIYQPSGEEVPFADGDIPAPPTGGVESVTSFEVVFEGEIVAGGETSIPFDVDTDPDLDPADLPTTVTNEVAVEGENDGATSDATASDDLFIYDEVIEPYIDKQVRPSQIIAEPGQVVTVTLQGGTTERPDPPDTPTGTTGNADQIVIQDPQDPVEPNPWWNAFDLDSITQTPIPADSELTIEYWDTTTDEWVVLDGPIPGPDIYSAPVPGDVSEVAGGIRFVYDYTGDAGGFAPGTDLQPNFTATLRPADDGRYESPAYNTDPEQPNSMIPDCGQTTASSPTEGVPDGTAVLEPPDCPEVELIPVGGDGGGDLIEKEYGTSSSGGNKSVIARSGDTIPSTLFWSTGGFSGFETVDITDVADQTLAVEDTVYDAFNLIRVQPITDADDPFIKYDQVTAVQLWNGTEFVEATNDPCPEECDGTFPGMDLTADEQESTLSVRLTFAESPTRAETSEGDLDAPPVGSGVARSIGNDRQITLVWQVRDTHRSTGEPALGVDLYNLDDPGVVRNTVDATGHPQDPDAEDVSDQDADDVVITDVPITQTTDKIWRGGPLAVPSPGTPEDQYPVSEMTVTTTNTTPAKVDQLQITDPAPGSTTDPQGDAFNWFELVLIDTITEPPGTEETTVTLSCPDGTSQTFTREEALALTPDAMPCDVSGVQVLFDGRIDSGGAGVLALDMRLRADQRDTGEPITEADSPIGNTAEGIVADIDAIQDCPPPQGARYACDQGTATIELTEPTFGIEAGKSISPATQTEGDFSPVTVTVSAQNSGSARPFIDTITDDDPTFWNAVDFIEMDPSWALPEPIEFVQACYLSGGEFTAANVEADTVGGDLTCQEVPPDFPQPGQLTLDEARAFIDDAATSGVDIHGLQFSFMAGDEIGWQNPANPLIEVPFQVERREDLRTGGPVPTTRSDQTPAPGEDDAGVFVDTVEVEGQSVLVGPEERLEASDTADAPYTHDHLTVGVEVDKQPSGEVQPGELIPFTLTYTNTGDRALTNPVFTDVLPSDADGNQLIFDPDSDPAIDSPYSFELAGAAPDPPSGDPLPTDQDQITITEQGDTITFEMPEGSVLEVGQTYTITIELMLRPGLTPDDVVTNTARVIADEPFDPDSCTPNFDTETGECWDDTDVSPVRVAALSTVKKVQADVPVEEAGIPEIFLDRSVIPEGVEVPDDYCDTAADADGFYRAPCVPVTYPGDTETWRFTITNAGTLPIDELVSMDSLPHVGDTGLIVTLPRDSEWDPTWADEIELISDNPTAEATTFYSMSFTPCTDDLDPLGDPCADGEWLPLDDTVDPADVHSIKVEVDFGADLFDPGEQVTLQFKTTTTPQSLTDTDFPVAWNTVATGGASNDDGTRATVLPTEGRKVGVTYPTGPIQLEKIVSGEGEAFAPDSFTVQLTCTVDGEELVDLPEVTLTPGADPTQIDGLPWGAECTATETDQGQADEIIGTATVGGPEDEIGLISVENVFTLGDLSVTKAVDSDAVDQDGNPITYGPFQIAVSCEFLGEQVFAEGFDADNPMESTIDDGETVTFTGLPTGAECTVTEPDTADAATTTITPDQPVEIGDDEVVDVDVENHYDVGSLHLRKLVAPEEVEGFPISEGPFTLHVACTLTDASHPDGEVVWDDDIVLQGPQPLEATIDNVAEGAVCTVTEPDPGAATAHVIVPQQVTVDADDTVNVLATNLFGEGALTVTKTVDGAGASRHGAGPFEVSLACTFTDINGEEQPLNTPGGPTRELSADNDFTATYDPLLFGSTCEIEETGTGGATSTVITDADGEEISEFTVDSLTEDLQIDVTNTFDVGSIVVEKSVIGDGPPSFEVELSCTQDVDGTETPVEIPGGAERTLSEGRGFTAKYDDLPVGAECDLAETDKGGADQTTITPHGDDPEIGTVTVEDGAAVQIDVENEFDDNGTGPSSGGGDDGDLGGLLPFTGAALLAMLIIGLALLAVGTEVTRRSLRRRG